LEIKSFCCDAVWSSVYMYQMLDVTTQNKAVLTDGHSDLESLVTNIWSPRVPILSFC